MTQTLQISDEEEINRNAARAVRRERRRDAFLAAIKQAPRRIVIGASGLYPSDWIPTEIDLLNLLKPDDWSRYLADNSVDAMMAERVWEHLSITDGMTAARTCHRFLRPEGYVRIAVPDGFHPDPAYIDYVRPGGTGLGCDDHHVLYNHRTLSTVFQSAGFTVKLLEYFDESHLFHFADWNPDDGKIDRSSRFDKRNTDGRLNYTSLILDAMKC